MAIDWKKDVIAALQALEECGGPSTEQYLSALRGIRYDIDQRLKACESSLPTADASGFPIHTYAPEDFVQQRNCEECNAITSRWCEVVDPTRKGDDCGGRVAVCVECAEEPAYAWEAPVEP